MSALLQRVLHAPAHASRRDHRRRALAIRAAIVAAGVAASSGGILLSSTRQDRFPHERHAGLFPACIGCHSGITAGDTATFVSITPEDCASCHDGVEIDRVAWTGPERGASNLAFPHPTHLALEIECVACHNAPDAEIRMAVERAAVETCLECHAPDAEGHLDLVAIDCSTCHLTLAQAASLPLERIASFPRPPIHEQPDFLRTHGAIAEAETGDCAICHARESCERCHVNADRLAPVMALPGDARIAQLAAGRAGGRRMPPSHRQEDWLTRHGVEASSAIEGCAGCHARDSCAMCHGDAERPAVIERLPMQRPGGAPDVVPGGAPSRSPGPLQDPRYCLSGLPCRLRLPQSAAGGRG